MENTVENSHGICIDNKKDESKNIIEMKPIKRKSDDVIVENGKNTRKSATMKNKCSKCNRKLSFVGSYKCRCGNEYCNRHRFYDQHECTFDYKALVSMKLKVDNPKIVNRRIGD